MIWRSATSFNLFLLLLPGALPPIASAATVEGRTALVQSSDSTVKKKGDFSGVVVWLTQEGDTTVYNSKKHAQMLQKEKKFLPHVLVVETGTSVDFPNLDPIFHNAFSNYDGQIFDVALYPPGSSRTVKFDRPGIVRVFCNIHPTMSAIVVVVNSSLFTTTDREGRYSFPNVSPGTYRVHFFHERATQETLARLTETVVVGNDTNEIALASISESGYLPIAHKNKYGQDYPNDNGANGYSLPVQ
jgi:plastocyanin